MKEGRNETEYFFVDEVLPVDALKEGVSFNLLDVINAPSQAVVEVNVIVIDVDFDFVAGVYVVIDSNIIA